MCAMHATETSLATTISAQRIAALIASSSNDNAKTVAVEVVAETGSTNADLLARVTAVDGARLVAPVLLVAESQTAGRGRAGRPWQTSKTSALTFSLAWKFGRPLHALIGLPLAVGVALAEALEVFGIYGELKWPNDVLRDGAKLAGVLIETAAEGGRADATWAVIGIGLNLAVPSGLEDELQRAVGSAPELQKPPRETVLAIIASALSEVLTEFEQRGFGAFVKRWEAFHAYAGQAVKIVENGRVLQEGTAVGVDMMGRFLMDTESGQVEILAGDVSLRLQDA
ncbi:biotin--[acetyl-CoA-carboxylase] ligase [Herbaspirillum huttiense]|uniref:biotin--[acetyl-CoA-carboxylase] ligase n=1 Tax=Herbaspirillum huttiense TaxID=863372 RepID=UPI000429076C